MAKKTLQEQHPESITVHGYAPVEELNYLCGQYEYLVKYKQLSVTTIIDVHVFKLFDGLAGGEEMMV